MNTYSEEKKKMLQNIADKQGIAVDVKSLNIEQLYQLDKMLQKYVKGGVK